MPVFRVDFYGKTLIDISDSTLNTTNMLDGVIGYNEKGERVIGSMTVTDTFSKAATFTVLLPASKWVETTDGYTQEISGDFTSDTYPIVHVLATSVDALEIADSIEKVEYSDGSAVVTFSKLPGIDLCLEFAIVDDMNESSREALACMPVEHSIITLTASGWVKEGDYYVQSLETDVESTDVVFVEGFNSLDLELAIEESNQLSLVTNMEVFDGNIKAICHGDCPTIDLACLVKKFANVNPARNYYNPALQTAETISPYYYVDGVPYEGADGYFDALYNATALIEIEPYTVYTIGYVPAFGYISVPWHEASYGVFFYDADGNFISQTQTSDSTFTTPINAKYLRFNYYIQDGVTLDVVNARTMLVKGCALPESYSSYT